MRARKREREGAEGEAKEERKRETHADRNHQLFQKNSSISRASLYPVSSLSLSRAPCLLEENELPVSEWKEYDKAFTCVSFFEFGFFQFFFCEKEIGRDAAAACFRGKEKQGPPSSFLPPRCPF